MMREAPKKNVGIYFLINKIWSIWWSTIMIKQASSEGTKYAEGGGGVKLGLPHLVAPLAAIWNLYFEKAKLLILISG